MENNVSNKRWLLAVMALAFLVHCSQHDTVVGKYQSVSNGRSDQSQVILELQSDGKGLWSMETDNASFRWKLNQNKISLHTRTGGVIEGTYDEGTIRIDLPGMGDILFKRIN